MRTGFRRERERERERKEEKRGSQLHNICKKGKKGRREKRQGRREGGKDL